MVVGFLQPWKEEVVVGFLQPWKEEEEVYDVMCVERKEKGIKW